MVAISRIIGGDMFRQERARRFLWATSAVLACVVLCGLLLLRSARKPSALEQDVALFLNAAATGGGYNANVKSLADLGQPAVPYLANAALWRPTLRDRFAEYAWRYNALKFLRRYLPDPEIVRNKNRSRSAAIVALGKIGPEARTALPTLRRVAGDDAFWFDRVSVLQSITQIGPEERDAPLFLQALKCDHGICRVRGTLGLGKLGAFAVEHIPALKQALSDSEEVVRRAAKKALSEIEP